MAPSSHRKATYLGSHRFYDYLNCLQEEFERQSTDDVISPRRFSIYLGNLKGEFELLSLEIESLRKERDEYKERVEVQTQYFRLNSVCERCNTGTKSASQIAVPSPKSKTMKTDPSPVPEGSFNTTGTSTITKGDTPAIIITSPLPWAPDSTIDSGREEGILSAKLNNKADKEIDVEIAYTMFHEEPVRCVKFSRDGKYLAAGCSDGKAYIYDVQKGTLARVLRNLIAEEDCIIAVCFSPDGKYLATSAWDGAILIWEINTKYVRNAFKGHTFHIMSLDFSPNGRLLVSASDDNTVRLWNTRDGAIKLLTDENPTILDDPCYASAVFSPDGMYVAASHRNGMVRIWDVCTGQLTRRMKAHTDRASCVAFMPDGTGLVSGGWDYRLRYWDVSSLYSTRFDARTTKNLHRNTPGMEELSQPEREFRSSKHEGYIHSLAISPDGRWVAFGAKSVCIRDTRNGATQCILNHDDLVYSVDFSPAGSYLASGGEDGTLRIWRYSSVASAES